jgi:hypothetical protein
MFTKLKKNLKYASPKNAFHINSGIALIFATVLIHGLPSCARHPTGIFEDKRAPTPPDFTQLSAWAAHPEKKDRADEVPNGSDFADKQQQAQIDVFFLHPTTYTPKRGNDQWNGDITDLKLNEKTETGSMLYQASLFNSVGRVFAPRYRQAHLSCFGNKDTASSRRAFDLAYADVKAAFEHFLKTQNQGRPIIIAAHSQGTLHAARLMREFFDGKPLQKRLVVAYILGLPVKKDFFKRIPICENAEQTGCYCTWRTFKKGYEPKTRFPLGDDIAVVNPLSWRTDLSLVSADKHQSSVLFGFKPSKPALIDAQIHRGILWVSKPKFRGSLFYTTKNYHAGDFNLFYFNVRQNVEQRVNLFWKQ